MKSTMNKVLVISVHPDDETLGCGGTLLKHKANNDEIYWCVVTRMKEPTFSKEAAIKREKEIETVAKMYSFCRVYSLGLTATKVYEYPFHTLVLEISNLVNDIKPNILYLPCKYDIHSDHKIMFDIAFVCTKSFRFPTVKKIYMMEVISETEYASCLKETCFTPNYFVDISDYLAKKIEIIQVYATELGEHPFPRSIDNIKALATLRGAMAGCKYAEGFMLLKEIG